MEPPSTLKEYVESQDRLDREARDMFPYDFSTCSFNQGYVKQQVFACKTCSPSQGSEQHGGVCYSCSITCHGEHDLIELFNRRAFRCDCGTQTMGDKDCCISNTTRSTNTLNHYNDNFQNIFCYCKKDYDADKEDGTMYQCLLCEDWFHDRCILEAESLPNDEFFEHYLCRECVDKESWLRRYTAVDEFCILPEQSVVKSNDNHVTVKRELDVELKDKQENHVAKKQKFDASDEPPQEQRLDAEAQTEGHDKSACKWVGLPAVDTPRTSLFLVEQFRTQFCQCGDCVHRVARLPALATEEEVYDPPVDDQDDNESSFEAGSRALEQTLQSMPRDKAIEGLLAFNKLKNHITTCLKPLADSGEIITSEHVRNFFESRPK